MSELVLLHASKIDNTTKLRADTYWADNACSVDGISSSTHFSYCVICNTVMYETSSSHVCALFVIPTVYLERIKCRH